jgi:aryl carrier-like protein
LTPNGKIDRKALPRPQSLAGPADRTLDATMNPTQRRMADVWRDVLQRDQVGLHANFFDMGGHSLLLVKLQAAIQREFSVDLTLVELFQRTTIAAQTQRVTATAPDDSALRRAQARIARQLHV